MPKQTKRCPPLDLNTNFIRGEKKNWFPLEFDFHFPGWRPTVITLRLHSDITVLLVLYFYPQSLGITLEIFHFPEALPVSLNPTHITYSSMDSQQNKNQPTLVLSSTSTPQTLNYTTLLQERQRRSFPPLDLELHKKILNSAP